MVLTGAGERAFVGAKREHLPVRHAALGRPGRAAYEKVAEGRAVALYDYDQPTLARIKGGCIGGWAEHSAVLRSRIASDDSTFSTSRPVSSAWATACICHRNLRSVPQSAPPRPWRSSRRPCATAPTRRWAWPAAPGRAGPGAGWRGEGLHRQDRRKRAADPARGQEDDPPAAAGRPRGRHRRDDAVGHGLLREQRLPRGPQAPRGKRAPRFTGT